MILIILLILIIFLHYLCNKTQLIENLDNEQPTNTNEEVYQHYTDLEKDEKNGPLFLAFKNAANISSLYSKISNLNNLKANITDISGQTHANSKALLKIGEQIGKLVHANTHTPTGGLPAVPKVTGLN